MLHTLCNSCNVLHPWSWVREGLPSGFHSRSFLQELLCLQPLYLLLHEQTGKALSHHKFIDTTAVNPSPRQQTFVIISHHFWPAVDHVSFFNPSLYSSFFSSMHALWRPCLERRLRTVQRCPKRRFLLWLRIQFRTPLIHSLGETKLFNFVPLIRLLAQHRNRWS